MRSRARPGRECSDQHPGKRSGDACICSITVIITQYRGSHGNSSLWRDGKTLSLRTGRSSLRSRNPPLLSVSVSGGSVQAQHGDVVELRRIAHELVHPLLDMREQLFRISIRFFSAPGPSAPCRRVPRLRSSLPARRLYRQRDCLPGRA